MSYAPAQQAPNTHSSFGPAQPDMWTARVTQPLATESAYVPNGIHDTTIPSAANSTEARGEALKCSNDAEQSRSERNDAVLYTMAASTSAASLSHQQIPANPASSHLAGPAGLMESVLIPEQCGRCNQWYFEEDNGPQACCMPHPAAPLSTRFAGQKATYPGWYFPCCGMHQIAIPGLLGSPTCPAMPHKAVPVPRARPFEPPLSQGFQPFGVFDSSAPPSANL